MHGDEAYEIDEGEPVTLIELISRSLTFSFRHCGNYMSVQTTDHEQVYRFDRPMSKRRRTESVALELEALNRLARNGVLRRCAETTDTRLSVESLVAVTRAFLIARDRQAASTSFECLVRRVSGWIGRKVRSWGFTGEEANEAIRDGIAILWQYVSDCSAKEELWECNFATCFRLRIVSALAERAERRQATVSLAYVDDDGDESDGLSKVPDGDADETFSAVECREVIEALGRIDPRIAKAVYLRMEGFQVNDIAARFNVTTRTIRNWMGTAREMLGGEK